MDNLDENSEIQKEMLEIKKKPNRNEESMYI